MSLCYFLFIDHRLVDCVFVVDETLRSTPRPCRHDRQANHADSSGPGHAHAPAVLGQESSGGGATRTSGCCRVMC